MFSQYLQKSKIENENCFCWWLKFRFLETVVCYALCCRRKAPLSLYGWGLKFITRIVCILRSFCGCGAPVVSHHNITVDSLYLFSYVVSVGQSNDEIYVHKVWDLKWQAVGERMRAFCFCEWLLFRLVQWPKPINSTVCSRYWCNVVHCMRME